MVRPKAVPRAKTGASQNQNPAPGMVTAPGKWVDDVVITVT